VHVINNNIYIYTLLVSPAFRALLSRLYINEGGFWLGRLYVYTLLVSTGINRGPSGLLAFLLLYTDATWEQACRLVKAVRPRARTQNNTFALQLQSLQPILPKLSLIPYSTLDIVDGAGGYGDESD